MLTTSTYLSNRTKNKQKSQKKFTLASKSTKKSDCSKKKNLKSAKLKKKRQKTLHARPAEKSMYVFLQKKKENFF